MARVALSNDSTLETWGENYGEEQGRKRDSFNSMIKVLDCLMSPYPSYPEKWFMCMKPARIIRQTLIELRYGMQYHIFRLDSENYTGEGDQNNTAKALKLN